MKKYTNTLFDYKFSICLFIVFSLGMFSCSKYTEPQVSPIDVSISGEELFKGIFFLEGKLPNNVKFLKRKLDFARELKVPENITTVKGQIRDEILSVIKEISPGYFSELRDSYLARDHHELKKNIREGADLLYVGLLKSERMQESLPELRKLFEEIDLSSYDLQNESEVNLFLNDVSLSLEKMEPNSAIGLAAIVGLVAAVLAVTVAVFVSWVGVAQVGAVALAVARVEVHDPTEKGGMSGENIMSEFDSELLTRDLINALHH